MCEAITLIIIYEVGAVLVTHFKLIYTSIQVSAGASGRAVLGYGYIGARTDTTQQSGQTPDKEV